MDGAKSAMYAQAVRNRGWSTVGSANVEAPVVSQPATVTPAPMPEPMIMRESMPMPEPMPMPELMPMPEMIPMPIHLLIPEPPVVELPDFMKPQEGCQVLAMANVHMQKWRELYETEKGFHCGTIFAELDLPFKGEGACKDE